MPNSVFVYGTLKRGQCRASMWPARPIEIRAAWVAGSLFGRNDYPAMTLGEDRVLGEWWSFQTSDMPSVLTALDQIEGTNQADEADLYHRVIIDVFDLTDQPIGDAFSYHYASDPVIDGFALMRPTAGERYVAWPAAE